MAAKPCCQCSTNNKCGQYQPMPCGHSYCPLCKLRALRRIIEEDDPLCFRCEYRVTLEDLREPVSLPAVSGWLVKQPPSVRSFVANVEYRADESHPFITCKCGRGPFRSDNFLPQHLKRMHGDELLQRALKSESELECEANTQASARQWAELYVSKQQEDDDLVLQRAFHHALDAGKTESWIAEERRKAAVAKQHEEELMQRLRAQTRARQEEREREYKRKLQEQHEAAAGRHKRSYMDDWQPLPSMPPEIGELSDAGDHEAANRLLVPHMKAFSSALKNRAQELARAQESLSCQE